MEISAHKFPKVYEALGIDLKKLGCIMLDVEGLPKPTYIIQDHNGTTTNYDKWIDEELYKAKDPGMFWVDGWVFDKAHITLLYGLLTPWDESAMKELVPQMLEGWDLQAVKIDHIGFFPSPYKEEPYYCIVAHIAPTETLLEGNERLKMLPHINIFPGYKPHATIAYIRADKGEAFRDDFIKNLNTDWGGKLINVKGFNFGGNK